MSILEAVFNQKNMIKMGYFGGINGDYGVGDAVPSVPGKVHRIVIGGSQGTATPTPYHFYAFLNSLNTASYIISTETILIILNFMTLKNLMKLSTVPLNRQKRYSPN